VTLLERYKNKPDYFSFFKKRKMEIDEESSMKTFKRKERETSRNPKEYNFKERLPKRRMTVRRMLSELPPQEQQKPILPPLSSSSSPEGGEAPPFTFSTSSEKKKKMSAKERFGKPSISKERSFFSSEYENPSKKFKKGAPSTITPPVTPTPPLPENLFAPPPPSPGLPTPFTSSANPPPPPSSSVSKIVEQTNLSITPKSKPKPLSAKQIFLSPAFSPPPPPKQPENVIVEASSKQPIAVIPRAPSYGLAQHEINLPTPSLEGNKGDPKNEFKGGDAPLLPASNPQATKTSFGGESSLPPPDLSSPPVLSTVVPNPEDTTAVVPYQPQNKEIVQAITENQSSLAKQQEKAILLNKRKRRFLNPVQALLPPSEPKIEELPNEPPPIPSPPPPPDFPMIEAEPKPIENYPMIEAQPNPPPIPEASPPPPPQEAQELSPSPSEEAPLESAGENILPEEQQPEEQEQEQPQEEEEGGGEEEQQQEGEEPAMDVEEPQPPINQEEKEEQEEEMSVENDPDGLKANQLAVMIEQTKGDIDIFTHKNDLNRLFNELSKVQEDLIRLSHIPNRNGESLIQFIARVHESMPTNVIEEYNQTVKSLIEEVKLALNNANNVSDAATLFLINQKPSLEQSINNPSINTQEFNGILNGVREKTIKQATERSISTASFEDLQERIANLTQVVRVLTSQLPDFTGKIQDADGDERMVDVLTELDKSLLGLKEKIEEGVGGGKEDPLSEGFIPQPDFEEGNSRESNLTPTWLQQGMKHGNSGITEPLIRLPGKRDPSEIPNYPPSDVAEGTIATSNLHGYVGPYGNMDVYHYSSYHPPGEDSINKPLFHFYKTDKNHKGQLLKYPNHYYSVEGDQERKYVKIPKRYFPSVVEGGLKNSKGKYFAKKNKFIESLLLDHQ